MVWGLSNTLKLIEVFLNLWSEPTTLSLKATDSSPDIFVKEVGGGGSKYEGIIGTSLIIVVIDDIFTWVLVKITWIEKAANIKKTRPNDWVGTLAATRVMIFFEVAMGSLATTARRLSISLPILGKIY